MAEVLPPASASAASRRNGQRVMVEFVSANPTGPLHVGHGRQAALGDAICSLLETQGWQVTREFYYNDAGVQIATLALSMQARIKGLKPGDAGWPEAAYNGEYIADIAADFLARKTVRADDREFTASRRRRRPRRHPPVRGRLPAPRAGPRPARLRRALRQLLPRVEPVHERPRRADRASACVAAGKTYEQDGALWLRTTDYGDDKDRVMRKSDGSYTYFVPDVAYHVTKWERGFTKVDQRAGHRPPRHDRARARRPAGAGVGIPPGYPDYVLHKMVTVMKGGEEVKISKRAGSYVTLRDLIDWTSRDAVRFFLVSRKADTEFIFDVDLALKRNDENPVYYVQYAHARICSVLEQWGGDDVDARAAPTSRR